MSNATTISEISIISVLTNVSTGEYFMYNPCENLAKCGDEQDYILSMAYIFDAGIFECAKHLAVWENGRNKPQYSQQLQTW